MKNFFLFSLSISILFACGVGGFYVWKHEQEKAIFEQINQKNIEQVAAREKANKTSNARDILGCLINLAEETRTYFITLFAFNKVQEYDFDSFEHMQLSRYAVMEVNFNHISNKLMALSNGDEIIKNISIISMNFSSLCRSYIHAIELNHQNPYGTGAHVIGARNFAEFKKDWDTLLGLVHEIMTKYTFFLDNPGRTEVSNELLNRFGQDINEAKRVSEKDGPTALFKLELPDGGWLPVLMYLELQR